MGMLNGDILNALRQSDFQKIVEYILKMSEVLVADYKKKSSKLPNDENQIRSIMFEEYVSKQAETYKMTDYRFDSEVQENYVGAGKYLGRVDVRILLKSDFEKKEAYYVIECKRIDGTKKLNQKYVQDGVARFVTKKYSSYYGKNIMLGFVVKNIDITQNTQAIENIQNSEPDECMHGTLNPMKSNSVGDCYKCRYKTGLELCHIFTDYSDIVQ